MRAIPLWVIRGSGSAAEIRQQDHRRQSYPLARRLAGLRSQLRSWRERRRSRAALASFNDRMLRDIGITRADADYEMNKPFWRG